MNRPCDTETNTVAQLEMQLFILQKCPSYTISGYILIVLIQTVSTFVQLAIDMARTRGDTTLANLTLHPTHKPTKNLTELRLKFFSDAALSILH